MGGGAAKTLVPLTADVCARAIIAAAAAYGDDPLRALAAKSGRLRRCLAAAADGLMEATWQPAPIVSRVLGIATNNVAAAVRNNGETFRAASRAASRAANYAGWRPEARVSVVGGQAPDVIPPLAVRRDAPRISVRDAYAPKPSSRPARPAAAAPVVPPKAPSQVSEECAAHLAHIRKANNGRGFPAPPK